MTTLDHRTAADLQLKRPAQVVTTQSIRDIPLSKPGRWVPPFVFLGLPLLFIVMIALGFITTL